MLLGNIGFIYGQQLQFTNFGLNDGLAQSQVYCTLEDDKGYIWMGTNGGGISRFNGLEFETFTSSNGLPSNYVYCLIEDNNKRVWAGTSKGLAYFDGNDFIHIESSIIKGKISALAEIQGEIWIGSLGKVYSLVDTIIQNYDNAPIKGEISFIRQGKGSSIWFGSNNGVAIYAMQTWETINSSNGLSSNLVRSIAFNDSDGVWIGTYGQGVNYLKNNNITSIKNLPNNGRIVVNSILLDENDKLWIATIDHGVCLYNPLDSSYKVLSERQGLANNFVNSIMKDSWSNIWLGTTGGGVSKYSGQQFEHYDKTNGLKGSYIYSLEMAGDSMWLSSSAGGVSVFKDGKATQYALDSGFTNAKSKAIFHSSDGLIWIGTEGSGMALFDGDTFTSFTTNSGLSHNWVKSFTEDSAGRIWIATGGGGIDLLEGFDTLSNPIFKNFNKASGLPSNRFIDLHTDRLNRIWFASRTGGIGYILEDSVYNFSTKDSLLSSVARSLSEDNNGNLWIATNEGINYMSLYDDELRLKVFKGNSLLSSKNLYLLEFDKNGDLWLGSEKGVEKFKISEVGEVLEHFHFGLDEGFIGVETNLNSVHSDKNGDMWFGTINGLQRYLSATKISNSKEPYLNFTSINLDYTLIEKTQYFNKKQPTEFVLPFNENNLTFNFLGITQTLPKKVKYQWRLKGLDANWSPISKRNSINYSNLRPGEYAFQVKSVNENGIWNKEPLVFSFTITKAIWNEDWFILSYIFMALFFIGLIIAVRVRRVKRKSRDNQLKISMEKDLLVLEQKALRLQMNPHFIFHTLNSIQSLIATKEEDEAREYLSKFSRLMRQILENSRQNEIGLDAEIETLRNYLNIERFVNDHQFQFEILFDDELELEFIKIPPMIVQPFIENAIIHGIAHLNDGEGIISIRFKDCTSYLECIIEDNGVGRKKSGEHNAVSNKLHKSTALIVTKERLAYLSKEKESLLFEDLKDEKDMDCGTRVTLKIPIIEN